MNRFVDRPVQIKLDIANGQAVWSAGTPEDLEDGNGKPEVANLMIEAQLNELLNQPFERALQMCPALQKHIEAQEDAWHVKEEFREAWGVDGPPDLRDALRAVLDPKVAAHNKAAAAAIIDEHQSLLDEPAPEGSTIKLHELLVPNSTVHNEALMDCSNANESSLEEQTPEKGDMHAHGSDRQFDRVIGTIHKMHQHLTGPEMNTFEWGGKASAKEDTMVDLGAVLNLTLGRNGAEGALEARSIDDLLSKPFDEVLESTPLLKQYIADQPDAKLIEQEFRENWNPDCQALRSVLELVLGKVDDAEVDVWIEADANVLQMEIDKNAMLRGEKSRRLPAQGPQKMMRSSIDCLEHLVSSMDMIENQLEQLFDRKDHGRDTDDDEDEVHIHTVSYPLRSRL